LEGFLEVGIDRATVVDSIGMAHLMADRVPIFSRFATLGVSERFNRMIYVILKTEEQVDGAIDVIQEVIGDLSQPETGVVCVIPLARVYGLDDRTGSRE
jgi:hypothetical protein